MELFDKLKMKNDFPFSDNKNQATFTCCHVINDEKDILYAVHDEEDSWQFLCGQDHDDSEARIISLYEIYQIDNSIKDLSKMPIKKTAYRDSKKSKWVIR